MFLRFSAAVYRNFNKRNQRPQKDLQVNTHFHSYFFPSLIRLTSQTMSADVAVGKFTISLHFKPILALKMFNFWKYEMGHLIVQYFKSNFDFTPRCSLNFLLLYDLGMMDGAYFTSRTELLDFFNNLFDLNLTKIEQTASGKLCCRE